MKDALEIRPGFRDRRTCITGFSGREAWRRPDRGLDMPFIFVSGTISETRCGGHGMKAGGERYFARGN